MLSIVISLSDAVLFGSSELISSSIKVLSVSLLLSLLELINVVSTDSSG